MIEPTRPAGNCQSGQHKSQYYRVPWKTGQDEHIIEACSVCGVNRRGPGKWVSRSEVEEPDCLPLLPQVTVPTLFDGLVEGCGA
jgi:hypothetical protein